MVAHCCRLKFPSSVSSSFVFVIQFWAFAVVVCMDSCTSHRVDDDTAMHQHASTNEVQSILFHPVSSAAHLFQPKSKMLRSSSSSRRDSYF